MNDELSAIEALLTRLAALETSQAAMLIGVLVAIALLLLARGRGSLTSANANALNTLAGILESQQRAQAEAERTRAAQVAAITHVVDEMRGSSVVVGALRDALKTHADVLDANTKEITETRRAVDGVAEEVTRRIRDDRLAIERAVFPVVTRLNDLQDELRAHLDAQQAGTAPDETARAIRALEISVQTQIALVIDRVSELVKMEKPR
jgi:hypothetical protein